MNPITKLSPSNNKNITTHNISSPIFTKQKWQPSFSRRASSFSSSSSSSFSSRSSSLLEEEFSLPNSPLISSSEGIPFSWETIPGIPKSSQTLKKNDSCRKLPNGKNYLPLPPPVCISTKHYISRRDPFYDALVECSKYGDVDEENKEVVNSGRIAKGLSTRFGIVVNMSCKNSSCVNESLVFLPRGRPTRISCNVLKK